MKYMGSKNRIAKHILPIMLKERGNRTWVEPFVGGANMIDKVEGERIGADFNEYLISMWDALQNGWIPPTYVSEEEWAEIRKDDGSIFEKSLIAFVRFGCSFGADWNGGFARNVRKNAPDSEYLNRTSKSYCAQSQRNILKQLPKLKGVTFIHSSYKDLEIPPNSLIYCDPPYENTTGYKDAFNHSDFWQWCREKHTEGHKVFISEYNAPENFECVWSMEVSTTLNSSKKDIEKLFTFDELY